MKELWSGNPALQMLNGKKAGRLWRSELKSFLNGLQPPNATSITYNPLLQGNFNQISVGGGKKNLRINGRRCSATAFGNARLSKNSHLQVRFSSGNGLLLMEAGTNLPERPLVPAVPWSDHSEATYSSELTCRTPQRDGQKLIPDIPLSKANLSYSISL